MGMPIIIILKLRFIHQSIHLSGFKFLFFFKKCCYIKVNSYIAPRIYYLLKV